MPWSFRSRDGFRPLVYLKDILEFPLLGIIVNNDLLRDNPNPSEEEIREGLEGNLCRCTGYQHIVDAVQQAAHEGAVNV